MAKLDIRVLDYVETAPEHLVDQCVEMLIEFNTLPRMALIESITTKSQPKSSETKTKN